MEIPKDCQVQSVLQFENTILINELKLFSYVECTKYMPKWMLIWVGLSVNLFLTSLWPPCWSYSTTSILIMIRLTKLTTHIYILIIRRRPMLTHIKHVQGNIHTGDPRSFGVCCLFKLRQPVCNYCVRFHDAMYKECRGVLRVVACLRYKRHTL